MIHLFVLEIGLSPSGNIFIVSQQYYHFNFFNVDVDVDVASTIIMNYHITITIRKYHSFCYNYIPHFNIIHKYPFTLT